MAIEPERKCGFKKLHGIYLCGDGMSFECSKFPYPLEVCPVCSAGVKFSRGWTWILPKSLFPDAQSCPTCLMQLNCPLHSESREGLLWIGDRFYSPLSFVEEANKMGISKRIFTVPRGFELGKTWVIFAHKKAGEKLAENNQKIKAPAAFYAFRPTRIEKIVTKSEFQNAEEMEKLKKQGITPVAVPDTDLDHQGSVYDKKKEKELPKTKLEQKTLDSLEMED